MHQNYYFLKQLCIELKCRIDNLKLSGCFSQHKDELVMRFIDQDSTFYITADMNSQSGILSFPSDFKRAGKNSIDLFPELIEKIVRNVTVHENERSFQISFDHDLALVFKLFGRHNNIILFRKNKSINRFKTNILKDQNLELSAFNRPIDQSKAAFLRYNGDLKAVFPTFGTLLMAYLNEAGYMKKEVRAQWDMVQQLLAKLENPSYYLTVVDNQIRLSLIRHGKILARFTSSIAAATKFSYQYRKISVFEREKRAAVRHLEQEICRAGNYIIKAKSKLRELSNRRNDRIADVIMANLHAIAPGSCKVELFDFYVNKVVKIRLNEKLSATKNAEKYYLKHKGQDLEVRKLAESMEAKEQLLATTETLLDKVNACEDVKQLKNLLKSDRPPSKPENALPYHQFRLGTYTIMVGRNARSNDKLTQQFSHKNDLWFHARDVAGSHVILKNKEGVNFPVDIIEKTAQMAAWFSKGKSLQLCPVIYTAKKYVRKPKGFAPGKVKVERERVILVEPKNLFIN